MVGCQMRTADPQLVPQLGQQPLEPARVAGELRIELEKLDVPKAEADEAMASARLAKSTAKRD
jgi:hypothetical protein